MVVTLVLCWCITAYECSRRFTRKRRESVVRYILRFSIWAAVGGAPAVPIEAACGDRSAAGEESCKKVRELHDSGLVQVVNDDIFTVF